MKFKYNLTGFLTLQNNTKEIVKYRILNANEK